MGTLDGHEQHAMKGEATIPTEKPLALNHKGTALDESGLSEDSAIGSVTGRHQ